MYQFFFKDEPNSVNDVPNFVNDEPKLPKSIMIRGSFSHFSRVGL